MAQPMTARMNLFDLSNLLDSDGNLQNEMLLLAFAAVLLSTIPIILSNEFDVSVGFRKRSMRSQPVTMAPPVDLPQSGASEMETISAESDRPPDGFPFPRIARFLRLPMNTTCAAQFIDLITSLVSSVH